ncbi:c-type cytochrome [Cyclobacterium xiamenense]|uniref:c-type cytochrome n=1 Tax=Cyclobacterium xiamenense TaxID=1297121 RepID=UPI0035CEEA80
MRQKTIPTNPPIGLLRRLFCWTAGLLLLAGNSGCGDTQEESLVRPMDPWAFRSVLDRRPRMLTLALDSACFAAYDLGKGQLYKVWKGGVLREGTVFTNKKNVQPSSWGTSYYPDESLPNQWTVRRNGKEVPVTTEYKGYLLQGNEITLDFELVLEDGTRIKLRERPEFVRNGQGKPGFHRSFAGSDIPEGLEVMLHSSDKSREVAVSKTLVLTDFFEELPEQSPPAIGDSYDHLGILWMENSDCYTCHEEKHAMVGPSFAQIAARYPKNEDSYALLASKIKAGGTGVWGETHMNPHPDLSAREIKTMLDYIFTHKRKKEKEITGTRAVASKKTMSTSESPTVRPGHGVPLQGVHPSYTLETLHSDAFKPRVGGMDFLPDGRLLVSTWDSIGGLYLLDGILDGDSAPVRVKRIASGLAEPLGVKVVDGEVFVLQKHELTQLIDHDGDDLMDEYRVVCDGWGVRDDFHEFAFGLVYKEDHFYITLSMAMRLMENERQLADRGRTLKIDRQGNYEWMDYGLRTPNGIGLGMEDEIFVTDNQGQWLPANKLIHVRKGVYNGMAWGLSEEEARNPPEMVPPAIWLPDKEIGNSPSEPILMKDGPYKGQLLHGDVSNGGIKRDFLESVKGEYQGAVFRFSQGFTAGVNRLVWGPDGALYVGEVGMVGGWSWKENQYGLEKIRYNGQSTFEMLAIRAKPDGFEIELTEPISTKDLDPSLLELQQWRYEPTPAYGGPKLDLTQLSVEEMVLAENGKKIQVKVPGLKEEHVVYFKLREDLRSQQGNSLWSSEAWYTLNHIPN